MKSNPSSVAERLQRLEDLEALKDLTARYAFHINKGWNGKQVEAEAMTTIFAPDAKWECAAMNMYGTSREQIINGLPAATQGVEFSMHSFTNPLLTVDGDQATGNWLFWIASRHQGVPANEVFMSTDITYVRTEAGWLIQTYRLHFGMSLHSSPPPQLAAAHD